MVLALVVGPFVVAWEPRRRLLAVGKPRFHLSCESWRDRMVSWIWLVVAFLFGLGFGFESGFERQERDKKKKQKPSDE
jgi:hypothetical protein